MTEVWVGKPPTACSSKQWPPGLKEVIADAYLWTIHMTTQVRVERGMFCTVASSQYITQNVQIVRKGRDTVSVCHCDSHCLGNQNGWRCCLLWPTEWVLSTSKRVTYAIIYLPVWITQPYWIVYAIWVCFGTQTNSGGRISRLRNLTVPAALCHWRTFELALCGDMAWLVAKSS